MKPMHGAWRKYRPFPPVDLPDRTWPSRTIDKAPVWCSVDLRDGNQALVRPMGVSEKLRLFELLASVGLKQIEVAFPSASQTEFEFVRTLIEKNLIPEDVTIQVLTQAREHLIRRTFESIAGAKRAIVHLYNSTSTLQREVVFGMSQDQILDLAVNGTKLVRGLASATTGTEVQFEYSPESFTGTELDFALRISEAVQEVWRPTKDQPMILNLPSTVELATPNVYADQIEWIGRHLKDRDSIVLSVHTHNDRGCAVAAAELSQMAGAQRVEGTLFGYGERTGNVDLVTLALNLHSQGVDPELDLSKLPEIVSVVSECTENPIHPRHPYVGELVFTAFSGSHQDAINKGMATTSKRKDDLWAVPYLTLDPHDIGRDYEAIIRVNSQSGKGGVAYLLRTDFGLDLPKAMHPEFAKAVQLLAETSGKEVLPEDIWREFEKTYLEPTRPYELANYTIATAASDPDLVECRAVVLFNGEARVATGCGKGPLEAFCDGLIKSGVPHFEVLSFHEHSVQSGASAMAAAYVCVRKDGQTRFGASLDPNLTRASLKGVLSAHKRVSSCRCRRRLRRRRTASK